MFRVIKYSFDETLSADAAARCTQLWVTFLEPFFNLPARSAAIVKVCYRSLVLLCMHMRLGRLTGL